MSGETNRRQGAEFDRYAFTDEEVDIAAPTLNQQGFRPEALRDKNEHDPMVQAIRAGTRRSGKSSDTNDTE